jgi:cyclic beta-1,2-glucan synthetase
MAGASLEHRLRAESSGDTRRDPSDWRQSARPRCATRRAWTYSKIPTEETHWLAPDNFQEDPEPTLALRTSPTNIGLQLLSTVSAVDLGFITRSDMIDRVEKVFRSLERMRRFRGHFFNWYDLNELRVLEPGYVSTVDSGNFSGHLIALKQACFEMMKDKSSTEQDAKRLRAIAERAHVRRRNGFPFSL